MKKFSVKIQEDDGYLIIARDFSFVTNTKPDKRYGRIKTKTTGSKKQKDWGRGFNISNVWRGKNANTIEMTWFNQVKRREKTFELEVIEY